jgi:hypothetical protein
MNPDQGETDVRITLLPSDPEAVRSLGTWISNSDDVRLERINIATGDHELGASDVLVAIGGSAGLVALVKTLPEFIRSRRANLTIRIETEDRLVELTATNIDNVLPVVERAFDE